LSGGSIKYFDSGRVYNWRGWIGEFSLLLEIRPAGPSHYQQTDEGGNIVLSGHHNIKGEVFRDIVELEVGETVSVFFDDQQYNYAVNDKFIVKDKGEPDSVRQANAKWIGPFNEERLTLVTCWPYNNNTHRVIVIAKPL